MTPDQSAPTAAVSAPTPGSRYRRRATYAAALVLPVALAAALVPVRAHYASPAAALTMMIVVAAIAVAGPRGAGVVSSISAALWFDFFYTRPYYSFTISHRPDLETTIAILVVGVVITELAGRSRHHFGAANEAYDFVATIRDVVESGATGVGADVVVERASAALITLLGLRECHFDPTLEDPPLARLEPDGQIVHVGMVWPTGDIGIPGPRSEILARGDGRVVGRFVLTPSTARPVSLERRVAAVVVADVAGAALAAAGGRV